MYSCGIYESKWHVRRLRRNWINICYLIAVLCRMFPFSLREGNEIVHQSHKMGACPPPCLKHFYREKFIPVHCFRRQYFTPSRKVIWVILRLFSVLQLYRSISKQWAKMWLSPLYPQGGWARNISSGRMSSRTIHCSLHYLGACHHISSGRMSSIHILREDEL